MITFSDDIGDEEKNEIAEILPQWKTFVLNLEKRVSGVLQLKTLNFLVDVNSKEEFKQWLTHFEDKTKLSYTIRGTERARKKRIVFKQRLVCQHKTRCKRLHDPAVHRVTKNTNCPSKLTVTIHVPIRDNYRGKFRERELLFKKMPCEINLIVTHNHSVGNAASLSYRQPSNEVKEKLMSLFQKGHSPATAVECIKTEILLNFEDPLVLVDRSKFPDYNYCYNLYKTIFKKNYGPLDVKNEGKQILQQRLEDYNNETGIVCSKMVVKDDDYIIGICSPLMQKIHLHIKAASKMVFMGSLGTVHCDGSRVFVLLTHSECGGLPLGIIVTSSENCGVLEIGLQILKEIIGANIFGGNIHGPSIFLTDESQSVQNAIRTCFPTSKILLCVFHVLQGVWRWLIKSKNGVPQEKLFECFQNFKKIMFAQTKNEASVNYIEAKGNICDEHQNYVKFLEGYWAKREQWAIAYRMDMLVQGHNTNDVSESFMRILKDKIFERFQAFNAMQMVDFVLTNVNLYFQRRLLDAANGASYRSCSKPITISSPEILTKIKRVNEDIFLVPIEDKNNHYYIVNMAVLICTCIAGNMGKICRHIVLASIVRPSDSYTKVIASDSIRKTYYFIATDKEPPENWLRPLYEIKTGTELNDALHLEAMDIDEVAQEIEVEMAETVHVEKIPQKTNSELISEIQTLLTDFSNRSPDEMKKGLEAMCEKMKKIKTPSACATHLLNFGGEQSRNNQENDIPLQLSIRRGQKYLAGHRSHLGGTLSKSKQDRLID